MSRKLSFFFLAMSPASLKTRKAPGQCVVHFIKNGGFPYVGREVMKIVIQEQAP